MTDQTRALTYEGILELFRETDRKFQETERMIKESSRETDRKISALGSRIGDIIENMVCGNGNIVDKFQEFGYEITAYNQRKIFQYKKLGIRGEIDLFLENGDVAILIEVKTTLETADVREHIERIEKYRRYVNETNGDKRRFIGAVAGAVVTDGAATFAQENGMYVIVQSGKSVDIVTPPTGFKAKEW